MDKNKEYINSMNVFPVPDGDTGTNMSMTIGKAVDELKRLPDNTPISEVASVTASALLRGARGNSGVILSQLFRGFTKSIREKDATRVTKDFHEKDEEYLFRVAKAAKAAANIAKWKSVDCDYREIDEISEEILEILK